MDTTITRDSRCTVEVVVEWTGGELVRGRSETTNTPEGRVLAGATAAIQAVRDVTEGALRLHLRGTKLVRAFDTLIVIVALRGESRDRRYDLIGSTVAPDDDVVRGSVLAVLDATNRVLEPAAAPLPAEGSTGSSPA